jgi:hypothetical protein
MNISPPKSVQALLKGIIDYAGLFPPSQITMPEAVINYALYRNSNYNWMLSRLVVPASRLAEFSENAGDFISRDGNRGWRLSAISGEDVYESLRLVEDFNAKNAPFAVCDSIEVKAASESKIENTVAALPHGIRAYFELAIDDKLPDLAAALSILGQRAKIRTGGITPDAFPGSRKILRFVRTCLAANVPFKATAGLHHPLRCFKALTYEADAPTGMMHGFLNLFVATGFAMKDYNTDLLEEILEEEFEEAFIFTDEGIGWRDEHFLSTPQIERMRERNLISFGSCSFDEPIADLREIKLL